MFHSFNALFLAVTFTPILIVYALFVDWEGLWRKVRPDRPVASGAGGPPSAVLPAGAVLLAVVVSLTWRAGTDRLFDLGGLLDWRSIWFAVLPVALVWAVTSASRLVGDARAAVARR